MRGKWKAVGMVPLRLLTSLPDELSKKLAGRYLPKGASALPDELSKALAVRYCFFFSTFIFSLLASLSDELSMQLADRYLANRAKY